MKSRIILGLCCLLGSMATNAQTRITVEGFENPESVYAKGKYLFVTNLGPNLDPTAKDGDGYISVVDRKTGNVVQRKFIIGLNSPKGMIVKHGKIHFTDVDKVVAYSIKTKKKVWEADLSGFGVTYANDIAMGCGKLFVSSTDRNSIYKVCRSGKVKMLNVQEDMPGANGLYKGCGKLFVANYGRNDAADGGFGYIKGCKKKKYKEIQKGGVYDGITKVCGRLVLSNWVDTKENKGKIVAYRMHKKQMKDIELGKTFNGPADIYADRCKKKLWIPAMREGSITAISFKELKQ